MAENVKGFFSGIVDGIKNFLGIHSPSTVFADIGNNMAAGVGEGFGGSMDGVETDMTTAMSGAGDATAAEAVKAVNDGIVANISELDGGVTAIVTKVIEGLTAKASTLQNIGSDMSKYISEGMVTGITAITQKIPQVVQSIVTTFTGKASTFQTIGIDIDKRIGDGIISGIAYITQKIPQVVQSIVTTFTAAATTFANIGIDIDKRIGDGVVSGTLNVTQRISQVMESVISTIRNFYDAFYGAGAYCVRGIWDGFNDMRGWLEDKIRDMMEDMVDAVRDEMKIRSPSRVFSKIGSFMAEGLGVGFEAQMRDVERRVTKATAKTVPAAQGVTEKRITRGETAKEGANVAVTQNFYVAETSYAKQQREAAKNFKQVAREVWA